MSAEVYTERNTLALCFAKLAEDRGWTVGLLVDDDEPDWPVLMIDTPQGQVSWHLPADEVQEWLKPYPGTWDGHTTREKYGRLLVLLSSDI